MELSNKRNILIIGGSGGLGKELARCFLKNGDRVAIHFLKNREYAEAVLKEFDYLKESSSSFSCQADIREEKSVEKMFQQVKKRWPRLDVLINNAGMTNDMLLFRMTENQWVHTMQVNLTGIFFCMKHASQWMKENKKGHVINIASRSGLTGRIGQANYASAKAGVIGLTKSAAREWGIDQIQANAVLPGFLPTPMGLKMTKKNKEEIIFQNALQKPSTLEEVSRFILFLSRMEHVSGQVFNLDSRII